MPGNPRTEQQHLQCKKWEEPRLNREAEFVLDFYSKSEGREEALQAEVKTGDKVEVESTGEISGELSNWILLSGDREALNRLLEHISIHHRNPPSDMVQAP